MGFLDKLKSTGFRSIGYAKIPWDKVIVGQTVYLSGIHAGVEHAYGPFTVISVTERLLENSKGETFKHFPEELMVLID